MSQLKNSSSQAPASVRRKTNLAGIDEAVLTSSSWKKDYLRARYSRAPCSVLAAARGASNQYADKWSRALALHLSRPCSGCRLCRHHTSHPTAQTRSRYAHVDDIDRNWKRESCKILRVIYCMLVVMALSSTIWPLVRVWGVLWCWLLVTRCSHSQLCS